VRSVSENLTPAPTTYEGTAGRHGEYDAGSGCVQGDDDDDAFTSVAVSRRRAVDASDLRQCALVQTKMKSWKTPPPGYVFHLMNNSELN